MLRKENAQAIVNADPFDSRVERTSAGTISIVNVAFINADSIDTSGVDLSARANLSVAGGLLSTWVEATWLLSYDVTNAGVAIDALGKLNRANVGAPNQQFSMAASAGWSRGVVLFSATARHIGRYEDDVSGRDRRLHDTGCQRPLVARRTGPRGIHDFRHVGRCQPVRPGPSTCRYRGEL